MNTKNVFLLGAILGVGYVAYKAFNTAKEAVTKTYNAAVNATSDVITDWFGPEYTGSDFFYAMNFAGGVKHMIPNKSTQNPGGVDSRGNFTFNGKKFVMRTKKNATTGIVEYWAFNP